MNDDLEDRLRRTYRAVATHTESGAAGRPDDFVRAAASPSSSGRWAGVGLVAAVVLLLVGGLAVIDRSGSTAPADSDPTHVLPTWMPSSSASPGPFQDLRLPLVSLTSTVDSDTIGYASDELSVTIRVDRLPVDQLEGRPVEVRGGETAVVDSEGDTGSLMWRAPAGPTVTIEWIGRVAGGLDSVVAAVDGLVLVDDQRWNAQTEFGGFMRHQELLNRTVGPVDLFIEGDLQSGLSFRAGRNGFDDATIGPGECVVLPEFTDEDDAVHIVVSRFPFGTATITFADGSAATVELSRFVPGSALGAGVVERGDIDPAVVPDVACEVTP